MRADDYLFLNIIEYYGHGISLLVEKVLKGNFAVCFNPTNSTDAYCNSKATIKRHDLSEFVFITTFSLTTYFLHNHEDAMKITAMSTENEVHHGTICFFLYTVKSFF